MAATVIQGNEHLKQKVGRGPTKHEAVFYIIMSPILKEEDLQLDVIPSFLSRTREKAKDMVH